MQRGLRGGWLLAMLLGTSAWANGIDNMNNQNVEYLRHLSRTGMVGTPGAVFYNPAGLSTLQPGLYLAFNSQTLFTDFHHEYGGTEYSTHSIIPIIPTGYLIWRFSDFAVFGAFEVPAGGGGVEYEHGSATTAPISAQAMTLAGMEADLSITVGAVQYGVVLGGTYKIHDRVSVALAARALIGRRYADMYTASDQLSAFAGTDHMVDQKESARGIGGIIGISLNPLAGMHIGLRYETSTRMRWTVDRSDAPELVLSVMDPASVAALRKMMPEKGQRFDRDLPAHAAIGISHQVLPALSLAWSADYYFQKAARWGGLENRVDDGWETALGVEYAAHPRVLLSAGAGWGVRGETRESYTPEFPALPGPLMGLGGKVELLPGLSLQLGFSVPMGLHTKGKDTLEFTVERIYNLAVGLDYKLF